MEHAAWNSTQSASPMHERARAAHKPRPRREHPEQHRDAAAAQGLMPGRA